MNKQILRDWIALAVFVTIAVGLLVLHDGLAYGDAASEHDGRSSGATTQSGQSTGRTVERTAALIAPAQPAALRTMTSPLHFSNTTARATFSVPRLNAAAPDFALEGIDGESYTLSQFKGKPVVLNFWASWCGPCRQEAPELVKVASEYGDRIAVLAVNLTASDDERSARAFAAGQQFAFPVLLDRLGTVGELYRIRPIPTTLFVRADGSIADQALGSLDEQAFKERIEPLLSSKN